MRKIVFVIAVLFISYGSYACITCNKQIQEAIFNSTFYPNLLVMLSAFIALGVIVVILSAIATKRHQTKLMANSGVYLLNPVPLASAATVLGIGIGGFIDGIVLHQILQWHEMISNKMPPVNYVAKSVNMFWDGIFHAFTLIVVMVGIILLWKLFFRKGIDYSGNLLGGGLLLGWALFNIVEGIIDHHILKLHNVREITPDKNIWNYGFLGFSVALLIIGLLWINQNKKAVPGKSERNII